MYGASVRLTPSITTCLCAALFVLAAADRAAAQRVRAEPFVTGLSSPVEFVQDPGNPDLQYVVEQGGKVRIIDRGVLQPGSFLDLSSEISTGGERGLLGIAFSPQYAADHHVFVNFTNPQGHTVIARFLRAVGNDRAADPASRLDLLWPTGERFIRQPFANHNGGHMAFGPDLKLYVGMGDGGSSDDPFNNAQNPQSLLGKMLRLDVLNLTLNDPQGYRAAGTAFPGVQPAPLPEIWAFGLRNPWKFSFDDTRLGGTGALIIGDVGQSRWEEINYQPRPGNGPGPAPGYNYGWRNREGAHDEVFFPAPAFTPLREPIFEYSHAVGNSITGGYVYHGGRLGAWARGRYFFGDLSGRVWSLKLTINATTGEAAAGDLLEHTDELGGRAALGSITSFGVDSQGELYVVNYAGSIIRIAPRRPDIDGDGNTDLVSYEPGTGLWRVLPSSTGFAAPYVYQWGAPGDVPVAGDFDGDGRQELAVYRPGNGTWYLYFLRSGTWAPLQWGTSTDVPVPADYDGDGRTDLAIWRPQNGEWWVYSLGRGTFSRYQWGVSTDRPVPADYDGDGRTDLAVWRSSTGVWYIYFTGPGTATSLAFGAPGDVPVQADYDGNGRTDLAVWRPASGLWQTVDIFNFSQSSFTWGAATDQPVGGDFDQDGIADLAVWRDSTREWLIYLRRSGTVRRLGAGAPGTPLPPLH